MKKLLFWIGLCFCNPSFAAQTTVAVAANFTDAMGDIAPLFEKVTGHRIRVSYGSTGKLYAQIENGAPFEVYLAADTRRPEKAIAEGLGVKGSRFTYAAGKLVLWSAAPGLFTDGEVYLKRSEFRRAAIANPKTAPYGLAAQQVLERLGIWNGLQAKLVRGESIAQTFQFVATGNAQVGFVALSQIRAWSEAGSFWEIPGSYYTPIAQQAVLLKRGERNPAARAFLEFLKNPEVRALLRRYGYDVD